MRPAAALRALALVVVPLAATAERVAADPPELLLPVVTQAAPIPSVDTAAVVTIHPADGITVDGRPARTLGDLRDALAHRAQRVLHGPDGTPGMDVVIRADNDSPWYATLWVMQAAAEPSVKAKRVHFVVTHRASGETGVVSVRMPGERVLGGDPTAEGPAPIRVGVIGREEGVETTPEAAYAAIAKAREKDGRVTVQIEAPPPKGKAVRHGYVVRVVDAALRAGASHVFFMATGLPPRDGAGRDVGLKEAIAALAALPRGFPQVHVDGTWVSMEGPPPPAIPEGLSPSAWANAPPPEPPPVPAGSAWLPTGPRNAFRRSRTLADSKDDAAVQAALDWLKAHQSPEGCWQAADFGHWCDRDENRGTATDGAGKAENDVAVTALAMLAFLGSGYTNRSEGPFGKVVGDGLRWLKNQQGASGGFGTWDPPAFLYAHAVAALAMVEAYGMTGSAIYKAPAQRGVDFLVASQSERGPWKDGRGFGEGDASTLAWTACVLGAVRQVNDADEQAGKPPSFAIAESAFDSARGRAAKAGDSAALAARLLLGEAAASDTLKSRIAALVAKPPTWDADPAKVDLLSWLWGSIAAYRSGDEAWSKWKPALSAALLAHQRTEGDRCGYLGSFDAVGPSGAEGGRVLTTALAALCLETPLRFEQRAPPPK